MLIGHPERLNPVDTAYNSTVALRLNVFGKPQLIVQNQVFEFPITKPGLLLLYLACKGDWVARNEVAFLFQPDATEERAQANLRQWIHRAKLYPWSEGLEASETHLRWLIDSDIRDFQQAFEQQDWQGVVEVYKDGLLNGVPTKDLTAFQAWIELEHTDLNRKWGIAGQQCLQQLEANSQWAEAVVLVERLRKNDLFDEDLLQTQLRLLVLYGRKNEALTQYQSFAALLQQELGVKPLESTQALADSFRNNHTRPTLNPVSSLPVSTNSFVGRRRELAELTKILNQPSCRLLSIVGLGGMGKTRLALELAHSQTANFSDGVFFVPLAGVTASEQIAPTIAERLGLALASSSHPFSQVLRFLQDRMVLLVLDNFEQLCQHTEWLETLLAQAPMLKVVVTSRQVLGLGAEWIFDLGGLQAAPNPDVGQAELGSEAALLFIDRAQRQSPQFVRSHETLKDIAEIGLMVGGMPLALELAASWVRGLGVNEIKQRLGEGFELLSNYQGTPPDRHQSIQHMFNQSLAQLTPKERQALLGLVLFEQGFNLPAAETLAQVQLADLVGLINRSLVHRQTDGRLVLHELLRQYLRLQLQTPQLLELQKAYVGYFHELLTNYEPRLRGATPKTALNELLPDLENLRQAFGLCLAAQDWERLAASEPALRLLYFTLGLYDEAYTFYSQVLLQLGAPTNNPALNCQQQFRLGFAHIAQRQSKLQLVPWLEGLIEELRQGQQPHRLVEALRLKAEFSAQKGDLLDMLVVEESLTLGQQLGHHPLLCDVYATTVSMAWHRGEYARAIEVAQAWLDLSYQTLNTHQYVAALLNTADLLHYQPNSQLNRATLLKKAFSLEDQLCNFELQFRLLEEKAVLAFEEGQYSLSEDLFGEVLKRCEQIGQLGSAGVAHYNLARSLREQGRFSETYAALERSYALLPTMLSLADLAETARIEGNTDKARLGFITALASSLERDYPVFQVLRCLLYLANFYADLGLLQEACVLAQCVEDHPGGGERNRRKAQQLLSRLKPNSRVLGLEGLTILDLVRMQLTQLSELNPNATHPPETPL